MAKKSNVNPDHYKIKGRDRQGEDLLQEVHRQKYSQAKTKQAGRRDKASPKLIPGAPPVGESKKKKR